LSDREDDDERKGEKRGVVVPFFFARKREREREKARPHVAHSKEERERDSKRELNCPYYS